MTPDPFDFQRAKKVNWHSLLAWMMVVVGAAASWADEHPVSIITADIYVNRFKATMQLKFFAEDLTLIQGLEPNDKGLYDRASIDKTFAIHREYLLRNIQLRGLDGNLITGKIVDVNDSDIPADGIEQAQLMNFSLGMVIEYSFEQPPEVLTISQDVADPDFLFPSEMKVLIKQAGIDAPQASMLKPATPETFRFDWTSAPLSDSTPEKDWQKWFDEQREKDLGISSYSSTYSFLYITRHEVRHEILVPLASLSEIKFKNKDAAFLEIDEQDAIKPEIEKYFVEGNPIQIDGISVKPLVERIDFYGADVRDFVRLAARQRVSVANGRVGVMLSFATKGTPNEIRLTWNRFSESLKNVEVVVFPFDKAEKTKFARYLPENQYVWKNPGTPPLPKLTEVERIGKPISQPALFFLAGAAACLLAGLGGIFTRRSTLSITAVVACAACAGFGWQAQRSQWPPLIWPRETIAPHTAQEIFRQLHKNIFRAFDYHADTDIYDALAASVDGPLLRELNLQIQERLKMADQGGAKSRIDEVNFLDGNIDESATKALSRGFAYRCKWNLVGSVEHWGHIHQRSIVYEALFEVEPRDRAWKITSMDITHEEPPQIKISVRRL